MNLDISRMIVVAIDNNGPGRMNEYSAWKYQESNIPGVQFGGKGVEYAEFVMDVVKPFIDKEYRTLSDRQHTAMIGSSLGGNITQFMGLDYKEQIGCLGVFSSANWLHQEAFDRYISRQDLDANQRVYIYVGTEEADDTDKTLMAGNIKQAYIDSSLSYYHDLIERGVDLENIKIHIQSGAEHNEEAWAENLPDCLRFFAENWD